MDNETKQCLIVCAAFAAILCTLIVSVLSYNQGHDRALVECVKHQPARDCRDAMP